MLWMLSAHSKWGKSIWPAEKKTKILLWWLQFWEQLYYDPTATGQQGQPNKNEGTLETDARYGTLKKKLLQVP